MSEELDAPTRVPPSITTAPIMEDDPKIVIVVPVQICMVSVVAGFPFTIGELPQ